MMIETLESRRLMAVDLSLTGLSSTVPSAVEATGLAKLKAAAVVTLVNSGSEALPKTAPAVSVGIYLKDGNGNETLISALKPAKYGGLKAGATKKITAPLKIPVNLAQASYTLIAKVDTTNLVTESDETNNTLSGATAAVVPGGTAMFSAYGFADTMTFSSTTVSHDGLAAEEDGRFTDINGVHGTYSYLVNGPTAGRYQTTLTLYRDNSTAGQLYIMTIVTGKPKALTLNGKTAHFAGKPNGGLKFLGNPNAYGSTVYFKLT